MSHEVYLDGTFDGNGPDEGTRQPDYTSPPEVLQTAQYVRNTLEGQGAGHDWFHVERVWATARTIALLEGDVDVALVEQAALLHDIADYKFHGGDEEVGPRTAQVWLKQQGMDPAKAAQVEDIIRTISFKGAAADTPMATKEGMIVQDADRLDALGAIGIARAFEYGGHKGEPMYDPKIPYIAGEDPASYKARLKQKRPTINHFYEKLFLLKDRMNTQAGKQLAEERHNYMVDFLNRFYREWEGQA